MRFEDLVRPFRVKHGMLIGILAIVVSVLFVALYLPIGSSSLTGVEWIIVGTWALLGLMFYLPSLRKREENRKEREESLFGGQ